MKVFLRFFLVLAMAVLMAFFPGCSDDDDGGTNSTGKIPGENTDLNYILFTNLIHGVDNTSIDRVRDLFDMYNSIMTKKAAPLYHADSKYWYAENTDTTYYGIEIGHDSIQFLQSGVAVQTPDSALLTEVRGGTWWVLIDTAAAKSACDLAAGDTLTTIHLTCTVAGQAGQIAGGGDVTISLNGTFSGLPPGMDSDCSWIGAFTLSADNLPMNLTNDHCPQSGELLYTGTMVMVCPSPLPSYSNAWTVRETFSADGPSWHFENETHYWDADGYCIWYLNP